jgi:tRNA/rRNA methyltransferase
MILKPVILLSHPSLSHNIGAVARAMLNFGLTELRLINPKANWLNQDARSLAADADLVLDAAQTFPTTQAAIADLHQVYAATARPRDMIKDVVTPKAAAIEVNRYLKDNVRVGVLFGSEKCGLDNEEIALCQKIITIPLNPSFSSINLAQAVILVAYEVFQQAGQILPADPLWDRDDQPASKAEMMGFYEHLESALTQAGYFKVAAKRPIMQRNLRNLFSRVPLTDQEVRTLRGVVAALVQPRKG